MRSAPLILLAVFTRLTLAADSDASAPQRIAATRYIEIAAAELRAKLQVRDGHIEMRLRGHYSDVEIAGTGPVSLRLRPQQTGPASRMVVWIDFLAGDHIVRSVPIHFDVQWLKPALVARSNLRAGLAPTAQTFELREADVAAARGEAVTSFGDLDGTRLKRGLNAGAVLTRAALEVRPPVEAGEQISVTASMGGVVVRRAAIAQRDGFQGERIGARLLKSGQIVRVEVVGENAAKVQEDG